MKPNKESFLGPNERKELSKEDLDRLDLEYRKLIDKYHELWEIEKRKMGRPGFVALSEEESYEITKPRGELHKKLLELGAKFGYSKDVVQMDILSREGNLGAYGMPEFGIINHDDRNYLYSIHLEKDPLKEEFTTERFISRYDYEEGAIVIDSPYSHEEGKYIEVVNETERSKLVFDFYSRIFAKTRDGLVWRNGLRAGECAIIFAVSYLNNYPCRDFFMQLFVPDDFYEKRRRAILLAKEFGFEMFSNEAYAPHAPLNYIGVVVPSSKIEEVAVKIFYNRDKFGIRTEDLGNTPRTEQDKVRIEEEKMKVIRNYLTNYGIYKIDEELMPKGRNMTDQEQDVWLSRRERWNGFIENMSISELKERYGVLIKKYEEARKTFFGYKKRPNK